MKILAIFILVAMMLFGMTACSKVPAGNVGVIVHLLGGSKGVDSEEVGVGRYWLGINDDLYLFPTYTQNDTWAKQEGKDESISFQTSEGLNVNADLGISYSIDPKKVSTVFQKYRKGVEEISDIYLRNMVRDALNKTASTKEIEFVYGAGKAALLNETETLVRSQVQDIGINVEHLYWVGQLRLPDAVVASINRKIAATQMAQQRENEIQQTKAEAQKNIEEARGHAESKLTEAKADADAIELKGKAEAAAIKAKSDALSTSPLLIQYQIATGWNGQLPQMTGGTIPLLNIPGFATSGK